MFLSRLRPLLVLVAFAALAFGQEAVPSIEVNLNHTSAGTFRDGALDLKLEVAKGLWHPEAEDGMALAVYAFGESGHALQNPGPLVRVPAGTAIRVSVHNGLAVPVTIHGLSDASGKGTFRVPAAGTANEHFVATAPGLYLYWGATEDDDLLRRHGVDAELSGALVVDPPGAVAPDEIFVIEMLSDLAGPGSRKTLATINGKSWPYTQRFQYELGQPVRWRWLNSTNEPHAMHLHGFYFRVEAFNRGGHVETYTGESRPRVVTQRFAQGDSFDMSWSPDRAGNWLFHCHMFIHAIPPTLPDIPGLAVVGSRGHSAGHTDMDVSGGMGQLVLGITVPERAGATPAAWHPERKLQLELSERPGAPRYAIRLRDAVQRRPFDADAGLLGPPIVLTRGQPVEIEVVNRMREPTAIHWHGIELENSYYDGVPGWTGTSKQITPPIEPGSSFVAQLTPPRAGTFIYHTHWHDEAQLTNGIYGPLIVLPAGETFDPASDLIFVFSIGDFGALKEIALINGTPQSKTLQLDAGKRYRFRFINISTNNQGMQVSLRGAAGQAQWRVLAKDGADYPVAVQRLSTAQLTISVGETYDVEFISSVPQELLLDLLLPAQRIHTTQTLLFN